jgi:hypothetical protein
MRARPPPPIAALGTLALVLSHAHAGLSAPICAGFAAPGQPGADRAPTKSRRKSTMDREMEIAASDRRERVQVTPEEFEADAEQLRRAVLTLWRPICCAVPSSRCRRGRQRPLFLITFLHGRGCVRAGGPVDQVVTARARAGVFLRIGKLDRRRSRWQPVRDAK